MPRSVDLREYQTPIRNQSRRTCTTFCSIAALEAAYKRAGYGDTNLSEGFFIYMIKTFWLDNWSTVERRGAGGRETQIGFGSGGNGPESLELLASGLKIPTEAVWPFRGRNFTERDHPWIANPYNSPFWETQEKVSEFNLAEGFLQRSHTLADAYYSAVGFNLINKDDGFIDQLETVLAMEHEVVLDFGINYTIENPDDESTRLWRSDGPGGESHCVLLVGFNRESSNPDEHYFIAKNSWGAESRTTRNDGFTYLSYDLLRVNAHRAAYITGVNEPEPWPELGFVGRWNLVKGNWNGRVDIYHIPGILQSVLDRRSSSEQLTDRRIGTFYGRDGMVMRVNGSIRDRTVDLFIDRSNTNARYDQLGGQRFTFHRQASQDLALGTMEQHGEDNYGGYLVREGRDVRIGMNIRTDSTIPLYNWWNRDRSDNLVTPDYRWSVDPRALIYGRHHIVNQYKKEGYSMYRLEGMIFNPALPQPDGTVPLCNWWNPDRKDNFASSDPRWIVPVDNWNVDADGGHGRPGNHLSRGYRPIEGYLVYRLEGFIYDPRGPQPSNTLPLFSWWHRERQDNMSTTDPRWTIDPSDVRWNGEHLSNGNSKDGYTIYRLEGYIKTIDN